ncbi:MAG: tetratricopeptide repeat-containing protein kinase family protein, partial [Myxococcota bacterium]
SAPVTCRRASRNPQHSRRLRPEQRRGAPLTAASDQYSLGLLLREALGNAPVWVKAVVERAVQEDPGARFPSCADLARALRTDPRTRYRRVIGAAALVAVGAVAVLLLNQRPVPCANVGDGISGTWPGQRAALAARFDALKAGWAPTVARQVESLLNRWADGLQLRARSSCESTVVAQTQSAELHDLTMRCVERIRLRGDALVKALVSDSGEDSARRSVRAVGNLPSAEQCSDPASLRRAMPLPDETEVREQVASLERIVAKRRASLELALKPEDTLPNTVTQAEEVNWPPLLARVRWIEGYSAELAGDADLAAERFERALWSAVSLREDLLAAESAARLVWVVGYLKREFDQATQWLQVADALVTASGDNRLRARLTDYRGVFAFFRGELEDAIQLHREALNILGEVSDRDPMSLGISVNLGAALIQSERLDEAETLYRELIQRASEALGASHPMVGSLYQNYATAATQRGNTAEAQRGFERALAIKEASLGPEHPALISTLANLSSVVAVLGELDAALGYGDRAMTIAFARDETNVRGFITLLNRIYSTLGVRDSIALSASEHLTRLSAAHFQSGDVDALAVRILRGAALASSGQKTAALRSLASVPRHARFAELLEEDRFEFHHARSLVTDGSTSRQALAAAAEVYRPWLYSPQRRERIEARFRDAGVAFGETNDTPSQE